VSDVHVTRYLLANNAGVLAVVPADRIMAGILPQGIALPALAVTHVSTLRKNFVEETTVDWCTSRVQVTGMASTYPALKALMALVRAALPRSRGTVDGVAVDAIVSDIEGPDFRDDAEGIYMQSHDFVLTFNE
jgi:hypothetical protein